MPFDTRNQGNPYWQTPTQQDIHVLLAHHQSSSFFIQAQEHNMPALDTVLAKNIRLIDYEKIADEKNNRLIAFGTYAGIAGAIDFMKGFG